MKVRFHLLYKIFLKRVEHILFLQKKNTNASTTESNGNASPKQSRVWKYFKRIEEGNGGSSKAKCQIAGCGQILSTPAHSTTTLSRHLRDVHKMKEFDRTAETPLIRMKRKLPVALKKKLDHAVLVAVIQDGRSFNDFAKAGIAEFIGLAIPGNKNLSLRRLVFWFRFHFRLRVASSSHNR